MIEKLNNHLIWDYFVITLFVITSGAIIWHGMSPAFAFFSFFLLSMANILFGVKNNGIRCNNSWVFIVFVFIICITNYFVYKVQYKDNSTVGYLVCLIGAYLIISRYDFFYFRKLLTNVICVITFWGLIVFLLSEFGLVPVYTLVPKSGMEYTMFAIYPLGWPDMFHRFSGVWHEPGACQIILNTVLWLYFDDICSWKWEKGVLKKIVIILIGSLATLSTGSYIVLMLLAIAALLNAKFNGKYRILISLLFMILVPVILYIMFNSPVIQNKLFDAEGEHISKIERLSDINALWKMTLERPFLGYGLGTVEFWKMSDLYGNTACSSGFLTYSASLGFSWMFIFLFYLWKGVRRLNNKGNAALFLFLAVILMQFNEKFVEYPITNLFIFSFNSYKKNIIYV